MSSLFHTRQKEIKQYGRGNVVEYKTDTAAGLSFRLRRIGVLWSGEHIFEGTAETLELLRSKGRVYLTCYIYYSELKIGTTIGKQVIFVTNNSTKSREDYTKKLTGMGIPATANEVFGSSYSAAIYISRILQLPPDKKTVYVLGEAGIESELDSENIRHIGGTDPSLNREMEKADYDSIASGSALDPSVGVVLCGLDFHINYLKLSLAYHYLRRGAIFLATNIDVTLPSSSALFPGSGACAAPLVAAMGGKKPTSLGKPSQAMMEAIEGKFKFDRKKTCMVGDRLDTDIRFGIEGGLGGTLCVLTGVTNAEEDWANGDIVPSAWVGKLGDLRDSHLGHHPAQ
ncbi:p-nitrophenyl phosphatase [Lecanora helva]